MSNFIQKVLEQYITGKDKDQPSVLENIYLPQARVNFEIKSKTISFPPLIKGNTEIAKVLSADFNKKYDLVKTYYLSHHPTSSPLMSLYNQRWLVLMREMANGHVRAGTGHYDWNFEKQSDGSLKISQHTIAIDLMLDLPSTHQDILRKTQKTLTYPWAKLHEVIETLASWPELIEINQLLKKGDN